jgi:hypothetical protein
MIGPVSDPRTEDTIVFELLRTDRGEESPHVVGTATYRGGRSSVEAADEVRIAVEELLDRAFVDRVQPDERPRGYRRSGRGTVERLVPGMAEHFIARLRGLWLSYPDGSVITAREAGVETLPVEISQPPAFDAGPPVTDPAVRRATLAASDRLLGTRPLVRANPPDPGIRHAAPRGPARRTDCGWMV